ncbi:velvet factor-domain-containing protein [Elsinoe ampelina]|uniref:Velvet factor-domain-containing protein n=1 Tax=Elsinoe ampelina TaxID=302913 RepID=A0A6A6GHS7_9PEZI|nr:velvet factor-domain-containing protein [Elsinoe ampelina]
MSTTSMDKVIPVANETNASCVRMTKEGKKITYKLTVMQQPERARACGSGAKSSADRRPVDPPPIVELRIFEGPDAEKDITFQMNANYFLFATLEQARVIAHGRVQQDPNRLTVLTGTPVAGLVYLDRPTAAGYFLFPDLSVRHEGKYRLSFNLYEELKEEKDQDKASDDDEKALGMGGHVTHRLEVKSHPFQVYSAKKFPGLATSTDLSRLVAEQGCRVRIRRDVRMRKHDKNGKEIDEYGDGAGDMYTASSGEHMQRPRSASVNSQRSLAPSNSRRPSDQDMAHSYHQHAQAPPAPGVYAQPHYPPQQQYYPQYQQAPPTYAPQPMHHVQQPPAHYAAQSIPQNPQTAYYAYPGHVQPPVQAPQHPTYDQQYHMRSSISERPPTPPEYRSAPAPPPPAPAYGYQPAQPRQVQPPVQPAYVPPPQYLPEHARHSGYAHEPSRPATANHKMLPALNTNHHQIPGRLLEPSSPNSAGPSPAYSEAPKSFRSYSQHEQPNGSGKRSYSEVFDTQHISAPMRGGARPSVGQAGPAAVDHDEASEDAMMAKLRMSYKRADGRRITKALTNGPPH